MKISIITVCKNAQASIEKAITSVITQTYKDIEYIIIDGDSQDGTKSVVAKYSAFISKFVSEPDRSLWSAMNKGIRLATGEFIYFLNSDDYLIDKNVVKDVVNFIVQHSSCDFVYGDIEIRFNTGHANIQKSPAPEKILETMITGCTIPHSGSFIRSKLFSKLGGYNENYKIGSDYEWVTRLMQDESLNKGYYPRTIASFYGSGLSSNFRQNLTEMFEIQNQVILYQDKDWLVKRIEKLQNEYIDTYEELQTLREVVEARQTVITAMIIRELRRFKRGWVRWKRLIGL